MNSLREWEEAFGQAVDVKKILRSCKKNGRTKDQSGAWIPHSRL